jgi:hypothetical protein
MRSWEPHRKHLPQGKKKRKKMLAKKKKEKRIREYYVKLKSINENSEKNKYEFSKTSKQ